MQVASDYRLGDLVTESPHPKTVELSRLANDDPLAAVECLKQVDIDALEILQGYMPELADLSAAIAETLASGHRIFLCGCGATGRLSIALEVFARQGLLGNPLPNDRIIGFMSGGDCALIRSIEAFEDFPEFGARQLRELEFSDGDLLISTTEGGETPFVIGATEEAARLSPSNCPYFLYCNPDAILSQVAERSQRVLENPDIFKINLTVGPMAITGSTRMQASTVLMAAVGWAIDCRNTPTEAALNKRCSDFRKWLTATDFSPLAGYIAQEAAAYRNNYRVLYEAGVYGVTALTDTTERSPTFSLTPFENTNRPDDPRCLNYLHLPGAPNSPLAWQCLLGRRPRALEWEGRDHLTGLDTLLGFDFSDKVVDRGRENGGKQMPFTISDHRYGFRLRLGALTTDVDAHRVGLFARHLMLKLWLNSLSTLVMGRMGRYEGNVMTYVSPTNNKLIDRAIRYVRLLLEQKGASAFTYDEVAFELFRQRERLQRDQSIVMNTVRALMAR